MPSRVPASSRAEITRNTNPVHRVTELAHPLHAPSTKEALTFLLRFAASCAATMACVCCWRIAVSYAINISMSCSSSGWTSPLGFRARLRLRVRVS